MIKYFRKLFSRETPEVPEVPEVNYISYELTDVYVLQIIVDDYRDVLLKYLQELGYQVQDPLSLTNVVSTMEVRYSTFSAFNPNALVHHFEKYYTVNAGIVLGAVERSGENYVTCVSERTCNGQSQKIVKTTNIISVIMTSPEDELPDIKIKIMEAEEEITRLVFNKKQEELLLRAQKEQEQLLTQERLTNIRKLL